MRIDWQSFADAIGMMLHLAMIMSAVAFPVALAYRWSVAVGCLP